ncbi:hypothetical protein, partial [Escherichia coli]|uniref:hypothetical protein n=2 Tax=Pseudomonadota TaxID=1224 RepID=UPI0039E1CFB3
MEAGRPLMSDHLASCLPWIWHSPERNPGSRTAHLSRRSKCHMKIFVPVLRPAMRVQQLATDVRQP